MDMEEQTTFVDEYCNSLRDKVKGYIAQGKLPETWNGLELRNLIADIANENKMHLEGKRLKEYKNDRLINNI